MIYRISVYLLKLFTKLYFRGSSIGRENMPSKGPCICVLNHNSIMDVFAIALVVKGRVHTMVKHTMFEVPLLKYWLRAVHMFPVVRNSSDQSAFTHAIDLLKRGEILFIAPEGTRKRYEGQQLRPRTGFVRLAHIIDCPVIPIAVWGTYEAMPPGQRLPSPVKIIVKVGQPIKLEKIELTPDKKHLLQQQADQTMEIVFNVVDEIDKERNKNSANDNQ
ncbi:1-acyl-sn-glycerol-3-phosphate acyltransferase [candidate division KSB1 bacterium]|nr:1-acyl-sn-glycerol-3-phosphate acyltransferase [candidate division KSB1 bacterium]